MVTAQAHLVAPMNRCLFLLRFLHEPWVVLVQPPGDGHIVSFIGTAHRFLGTHAPGLEIAPGRRRRNRDTIFPLNQARDGLARPEVERHCQLVRHPTHDQPTNPRGLLCVQPTAARTAAPFAKLQRPRAAFSGQLHPFADRSQAYAIRRGRAGLCHPATHRLHHQLSQVGLRGSIQLSGISFCLHAHITQYALFGAHVSNQFPNCLPWKTLDSNSGSQRGICSTRCAHARCSASGQRSA
ncbi:hypothetical protein LMG26411_02596 [Cupriavidus numazuensis]|uniref:Uncharacterized protein n=1 Tax=Cupriavidus numazuensis TaxID=221992 RepID=A0ABN7PWZ7_9BURK|nr:hypothetical protein LMG26411_02596 [Cupriavidus numazuensis]